MNAGGTKNRIRQGIILAAGLGQRMRPLSLEIPKPMVPVCGKPMIDYALQSYASHGVTRVVVNTHYKAEVLQKHLKGGSWPFEVIISHEDTLLDTGGGIAQALTYLDRESPVFVLSGDSILVDAPHKPALLALEEYWNTQDCDLLLSLQPLASMVLTKGVGDYTMAGARPVRTPDHSGEYMWNSARILHPRVFESAPSGPFSFLPVMDRAQAQGRLCALVHEGAWHHLTTPDDVAAVNAGWVP